MVDRPIACTACERPLICDACRTDYRPRTEADYRALTWREVPVYCPDCGVLLVCTWCKTAFDGLEGEIPTD